VSDPQKPEDRAPRPGAGDAARTQQIPRLGRDGKPVESSRSSAPRGESQRTVADALREARKTPGSSSGRSGNGSRRPAGPARPATGSAPRDKAAPGATPPDSEATAKDESAGGTDTTSTKPSTPPSSTSTAGSSSRTSGRQRPAAQQAPAKQAPATKAPAKAPSSRGKTPGSSAPTAGEYARTTGATPDTTAVIPAVKDDVAPAPESTPAVTPSAAGSTAPASSGSGRQARLRLTHVEPWSVTRLAFVVSVALMIVSVVAVTIFWIVLDLTGIWDQLNGTITNVLSDSEGSFDLTDYLGLGRLVGLTLVFSAINVVLMTAIATIAAHLYNLAAQLLGGIEVTFSDD
jgi:hypothetical protein